MSERKNHLTIDGGQVQEDEHVASYKPLPESDAGPDPDKNNRQRRAKCNTDKLRRSLSLYLRLTKF
ncbi:hypothetical protein MSG28_007126 [Choristoneura fumiferana]|uniref:Uncharacterized protein n=1 Tax=Choristoneura fumiferana TaxID=7141 RepID=A0ACC0JMN7_CHOFU|nr:hypothetical protein MSG28_007126 [Choristoneura fumiferana]